MTIAFVFPGQGAQVVGMGRDLYEYSSPARAIYTMADATLGFALSELCFHGPEERLTATEYAQPALLTTSIALLAALANTTDVAAFTAQQAACVAGHSLGEYTALVAAGALDFSTALRLVRRRGELMAASHEGSMAAVLGGDPVVIDAACREASKNGELVVVANYNAPGQLVLSGARAAIERVGALAKERGAKRVMPLKVSAAFHSPLMQAAGEQLAHDLNAAQIHAARIPVIANVSGEPIQQADAIRAELAAQVTAAVRWISTVEQMQASGVDTLIEIGPGAVLTGLARRIAPELTLVNVHDLASVRSCAIARAPAP